MKKRLLSIFLSMIMVLSLLPVSVLADTTDSEWGDPIGTTTDGSYTDGTAESDKSYEYTIVGSDGSQQTLAVEAGDEDGGEDTAPASGYGSVTETQGTGATYYELVTDGASGITAGGQYLIVNTNSGSGYALTKTGGSADVAIVDSKIMSVDETAVFTLETNGSGYNLKGSDGTYLYLNRQGIKYRSSAQSAFTIEGSSSVQLSYAGSSTYYLTYSGSGFGSDRRNGSDLYLFHQTSEPSGTVYTITWNDTANTLLDECKVLSKDDYSEDSWTTFEAALTAAQTAYDNKGTYDSNEAAATALATMAELAAAKESLKKVEVYYPEITWTRTLEPKSTGTYTQGTTGKLVRDLQYIDQEGTGDYQTISWDDADVKKLDTDPSMTVWDYNTDAQYSDATKTAGISAATWHHWYTKDDWKYADVRKISGTFTWPEGYDLDDIITLYSANDDNYKDIYDYVAVNEEYAAKLNNRKVIAVNDDMYVYVYLDGDQPESLTDRDCLAFYSGSVGKGIWSDITNSNDDWGRTEPASYNGSYATRAFHNVYPNLADTTAKTGVERLTDTSYLNHTDGWYTFVDGNAISSALQRNYAGQDMAGKTVHIDVYCFDNSNNGGMDELKIKLTKAEEETASVTVNYYLNNNETEDNFLGSSTITGKKVGSQVTLGSGYDVNQLNYQKKEAIIKAGNKNVSNGLQQDPVPYTVVEGKNVINVFYTTMDPQSILIVADTATETYDGTEKTVPGFKICMEGKQLECQEDGTYLTPDGQGIIQNVIATTARGIDPGKYKNNISYTKAVIVKDTQGENITNTYTITTQAGTLTITYAPAAVTETYDFGISNQYSNILAGTNDVEKKAATVAVANADKNTDVTFDKNANTITYTPADVNTSKTVNLTLTFAGDYKVNKSLTFLPESNVMYEENLVTTTEGGSWSTTPSKDASTDTGSTARVVADHTLPYGYSEAYASDTGYSNGTALQATMAAKSYTDDASFTFTGTGFDLISECGTDTGMLLVTLKKDESIVKGYLVDTYFCGDTADEDETSIVSGSGVLDYQVPVVRDQDLEYGTYTVTVKGLTAGATQSSKSSSTSGSGDSANAANAANAISMASLNEEGSADAAASDTDSNAGSQAIVETILEEAGLSQYLGTEMEVSFMDDNSVLNGGSGPDLTQASESSETDESSKNTDSNIFSKIGSFFRNLFGKSTQTAAEGDTNNDTDTNTETKSLSVYIDGFRVYQPLGSDVETPNANYDASEQGTSYYSLYDFLLTSVNDLDDYAEGAIYMEYDGSQDASVIADYKKQGPENEIYLAPGASIAFGLQGYTPANEETETAASTVQVSAKQIGSGEVLCDSIEMGLTATEMYYTVEPVYDKELGIYYVVIKNLGNSKGILSLSGLKVSNGVTAVASGAMGERIKNIEKQEADAFKPEMLKVTVPESTKVNRSFSIKVTSSTDVDHIVIEQVDGASTGNLEPSNKKAVAAGRAETYTFSMGYRQKTVGTYTYKVTAYNSEGKASSPVEVTIEVKAKS